MPIDYRALEWFRGCSPQEGDPDCKCSWCRQVIGDEDESLNDDYESDMAVRMLQAGGVQLQDLAQGGTE